MKIAAIALLVAGLAPASFSQVTPAFKEAPGKAWTLLSLASGTINLLDVRATIQSESEWGPAFRERNPLERPLTSLPRPAFYAASAFETVGADWLGLKMKRSERFHKVWWIPQVMEIAGHSWGMAYCYSHQRPSLGAPTPPGIHIPIRVR